MLAVFLPMNSGRMGIQGRQDMDALTGELALLERREGELSSERQRLHDRMDVGSAGVGGRRARQAAADRLSLYRRIERQLSDERRTLHERIDALRSQLGVPAARREHDLPR
jgi:hypothetical protein